MLRRPITAPVKATVALRGFFQPPFNVPDAKAVDPFAKLRPPAPPCASDARPFGSLNRSLRPMNYTNVNAHHSSSTAAAATATVSASTQGEAQSVSSSSSTAAPKLDLSKLLKRHSTGKQHTSSRTATARTETAADAVRSTSTSAASNAADAPSADATHVVPGSAFFSSIGPNTVGRDTVAKAQSIIAERERKLQEEAASSAQARRLEKEQQQQQQQGESASSPNHPRHSTTESKSRPAHDASGAAMHQQVYKEHCTVGWCPEDFYRVVADVNQYSLFLPWCSDSVVHTTRRVRVPPPPQQMAMTQEAMKALIGEDGLIEAIQMTATLKVGFSFFNEQYTSLVTLIPGSHITAVLYEGDEDTVLSNSPDKEVAGSRTAVPRPSGAGPNGGGLVSSLFRRAAHSANEVAKKSILRNLRCDWEFAPMPDKPSEVEVVFSVSFEFKNPMHSKFIMSNVVSLMTRSFESRCERLYGPPSASRQRLPALSEI